MNGASTGCVCTLIVDVIYPVLFSYGHSASFPPNHQSLHPTRAFYAPPLSYTTFLTVFLLAEMKSLGLSTILALSLPFAALAGHINQHFNRHQEVARRAPGEVQLQKRFDSARWSYYETQTGNALVFAPTPLFVPSKKKLILQWSMRTTPVRHRFRMFCSSHALFDIRTYQDPFRS